MIVFHSVSLGRQSRASFDLHAVVADSIDELRTASPEIGLVHVTHGDGVCTADVHRLEQLLGNLVANAIAYGDSSVPITVTSHVAPSFFSVAVHNAGPPIPAAAQAALFEPMTRGAHTGGKTSSVGLGLFIVREIARAHRGQALVRSSADEGTTFEVVFPRS